MGVSGGGNTAITEALYLSELCREVHIFIRGDKARAEDIWIEKAKARTNIIFHMNTSVESVEGTMMGVTGVQLNNGNLIPLDGLFVAIGSSPITSIVDNLSPEKDNE